tara:strand:- start:11237 stop:11470 length:234 start_codon:yes stop_codon:yes gene_type:complete
LFFLLLFFISSCAPLDYESYESGFLSEIWHGLILPFSLIGKLIGRSIGIHALNNSSFFYWLGFIIGLLGILGIIAES